MSNSKGGSQYTEDVVTALQWMWGDGYLAPGGPAEVAELLRDVKVNGCDVLDIGSGLGAIDVLLAETYGARSVLGIDVEQHLVDHACRRAAEAGLGERVRFQLVDAGPLPFGDSSFDLVFTKDVIVHVPDKPAMYKDVLRVLNPGGAFVGSDWLRGTGDTYTEVAAEWLEFVTLTFIMKDLDETRQALTDAGFERLALRDRNDWYRGEVEKELATLSGEKYQELVRRLGSEKAAHRLKSSELKQQVIEQGFLRPTHFVGYKPA